MRFVVATGLLLLTSLSWARPEYVDVVKKVYLVQPGTKIAAAGCNLCHSQVPKRNAFGESVGVALRATGTKKLTEEVLRTAEAEDSDNDGVANGDELKAGTLPAVPDAAPAKPATAAQPSEPKSEATSLWPNHSFHPLLTHFPIALFLFGAFLDAFGAWKKDAGLRRAGFWNLAFGAIAAIPTVVTGLLARNLMGFGDNATLNLHLYLTLGAATVMVVTALWRRKGEHSSPSYWFTLGLACALISAGGHFGAVLVHG